MYTKSSRHIKLFCIFLLLACVVPCFAANCLKCKRYLQFADRDCICNLCDLKSSFRNKMTELKKRGVLANWEVNAIRKLSNPNLHFIVYSAKDSLQNRNEKVFISVKKKPVAIQSFRMPVGNYTLQLPLSGNPDRVNVCFFNIPKTKNQAVQTYILKNLPLVVKEYTYVKIEVGVQSDRKLRVEIWCGKYKYDGFTLVGSGTVLPGGTLDCASL